MRKEMRRVEKMKKKGEGERERGVKRRQTGEVGTGERREKDREVKGD